MAFKKNRTSFKNQMKDHNPKEISISFPGLESLIVSTPIKRVKKKNYREIRRQLACLRYSNLQKEHNELRSEVEGLMEQEAEFTDCSTSNISFWKLEHPCLRTEIHRLKAKSKQLKTGILKLQTRVYISFPS